MENKKKKEEYIAVCPKCGSTNVQFGFSNPASANVGLADVRCNHCGHIAQIFPKIPVSEVKEPKDPRKIKDRRLVNFVYGKGLVGVWKIMGIVVLISSIFMLTSEVYRLLGYFFLPLSLLVLVYSFLKEKYGGRLFMKIIMMLIVLFFTVGVLILVILLNLFSFS